MTEACQRSPIVLELKHGNAVFKSSTLSFEILKSMLCEFYDNSRYYIDKATKEDETGLIEYDKISVSNKIKNGKKGKHFYTINFYRTTCTVLVNGSGVSKFITTEYPKFEEHVLNCYNENQETQLKQTLLKTHSNLQNDITKADESLCRANYLSSDIKESESNQNPKMMNPDQRTNETQVKTIDSHGISDSNWSTDDEEVDTHFLDIGNANTLKPASANESSCTQMGNDTCIRTKKKQKRRSSNNFGIVSIQNRLDKIENILSHINSQSTENIAKLISLETLGVAQW